MKLTRAAIQALRLPAGNADIILFDDDLPGFGLRMRGGSSRSEARWLVQYKIGSKHRRLTFGKFSEVDPSRARDRARDLLSAVRLGGDPAGAKHEARARADETFGMTLRPFANQDKANVLYRTFSSTLLGETSTFRQRVRAGVSLSLISRPETGVHRPRCETCRGEV
jgi:Arm DNA-binding domain